MHHFAIAKDRDCGCERGEREGNGDHAGLPGVQRECAPDAAEQPRKRVRAQAGGPLSLGLPALLPAALYSDDEADGERDRQPPNELKRIHGTTEVGFEDAAGRSSY